MGVKRGKARSKIKVKTKKGYIVKPGYEHPKEPGFKFVSAHKTEASVLKDEEKLIEKREVRETLVTPMPKHFILWKKTGMPRLTPKRPRL